MNTWYGNKTSIPQIKALFNQFWTGIGKKLSKNQAKNIVLTVADCRWCMLLESLSKLPSLKCKLPMESRNIKSKYFNETETYD